VLHFNLEFTPELKIKDSRPLCVSLTLISIFFDPDG
jgi:hypothetical protein